MQKQKPPKVDPYLIGYPSDLVIDSHDTDVYADKLGGRPIWFPIDDKDSSSSTTLPHLPICDNCSHPLFLVTQFQAPIKGNTTQDRVFYVFGCNSRKCMTAKGGWKVIRGIKSYKSLQVLSKREKESVKPAVSIAPPVFPSFGGDGSSSFDSPTTSNDTMNNLQKLLDQRNKSWASKVSESSSAKESKSDSLINVMNNLQLQTPPQTPSRIESNESNESHESTKSFPGTYLIFETENLKSKYGSQDFAHEMKLLRQYQQTEFSDSTDGVNEGYEKSTHPYFKSHFKRFHRSVSDDPEQCIRYQRNGLPLFYANRLSQDVLSPPHCEYCRGPRRFEFQLMPNILQQLPVSKFAIKSSSSTDPTKKLTPLERLQMDSGMEFGTVLVFTCERNCDLDDWYNLQGERGREQAMKHISESGMVFGKDKQVRYFYEKAIVQVEE